MRLLFIALTSLSTGEVGVGLDVADQVTKAGVECHFIVEPIATWLLKSKGYPHTVVDAPIRAEVRTVVRETVRSFQPDIIVLSDYFTYCAELELRFGVDPWFIDDLGVPILPIDIYEWETTDFKAQLFGDSVIDISNHIVDMPVQLRPVPSAHPDTASIGNGVPYRSCRQSDRVTAATRWEVFGSLGLVPDRERLLLIPVSSWHHPLPEIMGDPRQRVTERLPDLIVGYLRQLPADTHFVVVGKPLRALRELPADRLHLVPPCSPKRFSELIGSADAMVSFHLPSQTLARTVFADVPAFAMRNSFSVPDASHIDRVAAELGGLTPAVRTWLTELAAPVYPFDSWPWRLTSLVRGLLTDNPLTDAMVCVEVFDEASFVASLAAVLYDAGTRDRLAAARDAYAGIVGRIPTVDAVLPDIARRFGLATA